MVAVKYVIVWTLHVFQVHFDSFLFHLDECVNHKFNHLLRLIESAESNWELKIVRLAWTCLCGTSLSDVH